MLFFTYNGALHCVDATAEDRALGPGRLMNHSRSAPNLTLRRVMVQGAPRMSLVALHRIEAGEELVWDYGEEREDVLEAAPWLRES